jgi:hypothetical protein
MKTGRYVSIAMLGIFVVTARASADSSGSDPANDPINPYTQYDPDGIPLSVTRPQPKPVSQEQADAMRKEQARAALDKNWLLRNYEQQLRARAAKSSEGQSANLYYQLSSNKELAKLAGLPALDSEAQDSSTFYRTGATPSGRGALALRADTSSGSPSHPSFFKPLLTPLNSASASAANSFYAPLAISMPSPVSSGYSQTPPAPEAKQSRISSDLETPGMVAAGKNPLMDMTTRDLTLDILPGESIVQARAHQDNNIKLELPLPMDVNRLHKSQAATLSVPGASNTAQTPKPTPAPVKPLPTDDESAPLPVSKAPAINPVRAPVANPYDILNR